MQQIVSLVAAHANSTASYLWNNKILVSTFSGENQGPDQWAFMKSQLASQGIQVSFAPAFISYRHADQFNGMLSSFPAVDGFFNWWAWYVACPCGGSECRGNAIDDRPEDSPTNVTTTDDIAMQNAIHSQRTGPYIMGIRHCTLPTTCLTLHCSREPVAVQEPWLGDG